jgi:homoserine kinase
MFPEAPQLLARMVKSGALASCWSGAGPTLLGICDGEQGERVCAGAQEAMEEIGVPGRAMLLRPDLEGLIVEGAYG